ncbi:MAG: hypothetical protein A2Y95_10990 [Deltaproteobacteria bacterium RBG_13_65_10]|nr:MAG: hypothetical protein A2Y95_10990 [Deltaproteobacteria bacterium RBG_13_65_10]
MNGMIRLRGVAAVLSLVVLALLPACGGETRKEDAGAPDAGTASGPPLVRLRPEALARARISIQPVEVRRMPSRVQTTGEVAFDDKYLAHVFSRVDGWVEDVNAFLEDKVRVGQPLLTVYSPNFIVAQSEYLQADRRADLSCGRREDSPECRTARAILRSARTKLRILGASEEDIRAIGRTHETRPTYVLRAPIGGSIVETNVVRGNAIKAGDDLFKIANLSRVWVNVDVYEKDIARVSRGDRVEVRLSPYPGAVFSGRLSLVSEVVDEKKRTVRARAEIDNKDGRLRPGMFAEVSILWAPEGIGVAMIPDTAVQNVQGEPAAFVERGRGVFELRHVRLGEEREGLVSVTEGLREGERVVVQGSFILKAEFLKGTLEEE